ncbi:Asp23/Gls24 family envelope stress response protein [Nesterenkonia sandarakina]|uniref:Putative alkaline shock family protein YloU n=1 Tax=Nesterenkonia sandarakina TaxID=272918 RepID=A0A7Z0E5K2_9MICC|nr:Asp23/Gls24 family envelope stress response protein [Nesterenkonia sandarakina]NYJ15506.1 putative alkaline shock family protein YloU [Nesterenkonia sandarakina]
MSIAAPTPAAAHASARSAPTPERAMTPAETRGRLTVKDAAVEHTAAYIAGQLSGVSATDRFTIAGIGIGPGNRPRPKTEVEITGGIANITVHLALPYPAPLEKLTDDARRHISDEVTRLTGVSVGWVDVRIDQLLVGTGERTLQ